MSPEDAAQFINAAYGPPLQVLADCLRGMIIPAPGHDLIAMDFSQIEARVLPWLAGQDSTLEIFRTGQDIYRAAGSGIFRIPAEEVTSSQRQVSKVAVLALGYGGGVGAFQAMAKNYNVKVPDTQAEEIKKAWRAANPKIVQYWYDLDNASIQALASGAIERVGPPGREVAFVKKGSFLWCKLPSGRLLCYPYPEIRTVITPWGAERDALTFMSVVASGQKVKSIPDDNASGTWKRVSTFGGSLAENITQAVARDLLADALKRLEKAGFRTVFHVHDEAVVEVATTSDNGILKRIEDLMAEVPSWAAGLPLAAEGWRGPRYRKG